MWDTIYPYVAALGPTAGILLLFYFIIKYIFEADRRERLAQSQWEKANPAPDRVSDTKPEQDSTTNTTTEIS